MFKEAELFGYKFSVNEDGSAVYYNGTYLKQRLIQPKGSARGFKYVNLFDRLIYIHRLVAVAFIPNVNNHPLACHVDTNTLNNHFTNIEWGNAQFVAQNLKVAGRGPRRRSKIPLSEHPTVVLRLNNGECGSLLAREYNTSEMSINRIKQKYGVKTNLTSVYDNSLKDKVREYLKSEKTVRDTANVFNLPYERVWRWAKTWNIEIKSDDYRKPLDSELVNVVANALRCGDSAIFISEEYGVSLSSVYKIKNTLLCAQNS